MSEVYKVLLDYAAFIVAAGIIGKLMSGVFQAKLNQLQLESTKHGDQLTKLTTEVADLKTEVAILRFQVASLPNRVSSAITNGGTQPS